MNNAKDSYALWKKEEQVSFSGWNFSYIRSRLKEEKPSWDYIEEAKKLAENASAVLDMGTGGGEDFSKLGRFLSIPLLQKAGYRTFQLQERSWNH